MFNRLNRIVAFAMCLGGAVFLTIGCMESDDTAVTTAAASETRAAQASEDRQQVADAQREASEQTERDRARAEAARDRAAVTEPVRRATDRSATQDTQRERPEPERSSRQPERGSDDLLFSPAESHEKVVAAIPDIERESRRDHAQNEPRVEVTPSLLDLGAMSTSETKTGTMTIRNISDEPVMIENSRTSCGCTVANVPRGQYLQPGESVDVDVSLRSSTRPQVLTKTVTFLIRDHPPITARVRGEVVTYVAVEPNILNPDSLANDTVVIRSEDGEPFRITSMHPQITLEEPSEEAAASHEFTISWEQWRELGEARRVLFYTDHPKASQVLATIRPPRRRPDREFEPPTRAASDRTGRAERERQTGPNPFALIQRGNTAEFIELLKSEEVNLNRRDRTGQTLLAVAGRHGNVEIVNALIEAGIDVDEADNVGRTPLMTAGQSRQPEVVKRLIEAGADLELTDNTIGGTALAWTAAFGDAESVKLLVEAGSNVDVPTEATGFTPLIWAAGFGQSESVRHLIEAGADIEFADRTEKATPLMHATRTGRTENVKALIAGGAKLEAKDNAGKTPLLWAAGASGADVETIRALVEAGADVNARDRAGLGVLDHARGRTDPNAHTIIDYLTSLVGDDAGN